jgi:hypothetical protein
MATGLGVIKSDHRFAIGSCYLTKIDYLTLSDGSLECLPLFSLINLEPVALSTEFLCIC